MGGECCGMPCCVARCGVGAQLPEKSHSAHSTRAAYPSRERCPHPRWGGCDSGPIEQRTVIACTTTTKHLDCFEGKPRSPARPIEEYTKLEASSHMGTPARWMELFIRNCNAPHRRAAGHPLKGSPERSNARRKRSINTAATRAARPKSTRPHATPERGVQRGLRSPLSCDRRHDRTARVDRFNPTSVMGARHAAQLCRAGHMNWVTRGYPNRISPRKGTVHGRPEIRSAAERFKMDAQGSDLDDLWVCWLRFWPRGRCSTFRPPDASRRIASGCQKSTPRPKSESEKREIVQIWLNR